VITWGEKGHDRVGTSPDTLVLIVTLQVGLWVHWGASQKLCAYKC